MKELLTLRYGYGVAKTVIRITCIKRGINQVEITAGFNRPIEEPITWMAVLSHLTFLSAQPGIRSRSRIGIKLNVSYDLKLRHLCFKLLSFNLHI